MMIRVMLMMSTLLLLLLLMLQLLLTDFVCVWRCNWEGIDMIGIGVE